MKKTLLFLVLFSFGFVNAQSDKFWKKHDGTKSKIALAKIAQRETFPEKFDLYVLNIEALRSSLFESINKKSSQKTIITLPNAYGQIEEFEMFEASNFEPELQAQFPEIRAFSGKGITDKYATLKLSISPQGIQTMVFRTDKPNEFMEPYSSDNKIYAVYHSQRKKERFAWTCSTEEKVMMEGISRGVANANITQKSSDTTLRTLRLAQSCTGEYAAFFGASTANNAADKAIVMTAFNNTMTRCNGVYEKDLGLHLNLIANTTAVIYTNAATDPYDTVTNALTPPSTWGPDLQTTLTNIIGDANYDIGHLFGASGGGGSAGCIGCYCGVADTATASWIYLGNGKGSGITSPATGTLNSSAAFPPAGDTFDIDYVTHEVGHQLGMNHSFTYSSQVTAAQMEVGSGVTIMGYAGITDYDVARHSIDTYHAYNIYQYQTVASTKPCPVVQSVSANNVAPVASAGKDYIIPISTPFVLEGSANDANGDALTYQWEEMDGINGQSGASSPAAVAKASGPNWVSWLPTASPNRFMPKLSSIIANSATTSGTGDEIILIEALSSVGRDLNYRLTVRDNAPYSSSTPEVGQTNYDDMKVTVSAAAGPFAITVPSANGLSYNVGTNQTVTWNVASTNTGAVNTPYVDIYLFTDNTLTNGILLASKVPNDGSETVTIPNNVGTTHRIMVRGNGNIFFDISNNNFTIAAPASSFAVAFNGTSGEQNKGTCQTVSAVNYTFNYTALSGFSGTTNFTASGVPANTTVTFTPASRTTSGTVTMTVNTTATTPAGIANIVVNATSGATTKTVPFYLDVQAAPQAAVLSSPANNANALDITVNLTWTAGANATAYDVQVATDSGFTNIIATGATAGTSYTLSGLSQSTSYYWRVMPKNAGCSGVYGAAFKFTTGIVNCSTTTNSTVQAIASNGKPTVTSTINIPSGVSITDLNLGLNITHSVISDLVISLASPTGTSVTVFNKNCGANNNIVATYDDSGVPVVCGTTPAVSGTVAPLNPLSAFNGQSSTGTWTLTVADTNAGSGGGGSLNSWTLNICNIQAALSNPDYEFANLRVFPNPNKGNFAIELNSESSKEIQVSVFDLRGRQIFNRSFANNGAFNQNINLENAQSGVYLVSISDGIKKTVKRIIVE